MPCASSEGTQRYMTAQIDAGMPPHAFATLGRTGLKASRMGFGTYRVDDYHSQYKEALSKALQSGVNVIDTSTNYTDGSSERVIGKTLQELFESKKINRDENHLGPQRLGTFKGTT